MFLHKDKMLQNQLLIDRLRPIADIAVSRHSIWSDMSTSFDKLNTWLGLIFLTLCAALFGYRFVSSEARAGRQFLENIPLTEVTYVRLDPAGDHPLVDRPLVVCDKPDIRALLASMTAMERYSPQHPNTTWSIAIRIGTNEHEYGGVITGTSNQGVLFRYSSKITTGWIFQQYRMTDPSLAIRSVIESQVDCPASDTTAGS